MASTILAVDDSVTMRKVLEITFAGPDFRVVTANGPDAAMKSLGSEKPDLVLCDITLEPKSGYDVCKQIKQQSPSTLVVLMSSKQFPFDAAKGADAKCDDHVDKPFDTQQLIDKVKKILSGGTSTGAAAPAPAVKPAAAPTAASPVAAAAKPAAAPAAAPTNPGTGIAPAAAAQQPGRAKTLVYSPATTPLPPAAVARTDVKPASPQPTPVSGVPLNQPRPNASTAVSPGPSPIAAQVNGQMSAKLEGLGLSPQQAEAVLALSREVVERVVWEVVPVLAETIIKEELARLTR